MAKIFTLRWMYPARLLHEEEWFNLSIRGYAEPMVLSAICNRTFLPAGSAGTRDGEVLDIEKMGHGVKWWTFGRFALYGKHCRRSVS